MSDAMASERCAIERNTLHAEVLVAQLRSLDGQCLAIAQLDGRLLDHWGMEKIIVVSGIRIESEDVEGKPR